MRAKKVKGAKGRRQAFDACLEPCAFECGMRIIDEKWTGSIHWHLQNEPVHFNDLARMFRGVSKKMITERLRKLEAWGLVTRHAMDTVPVSVQYMITPFGRTALGFLDELRGWSESLAKQADAVD